MIKYRIKITQTRIEYFDVVANDQDEAISIAKTKHLITDLFNDSGVISTEKFEIINTEE